MAMVFPVNPVITEFCLCTVGITSLEEALSKERLQKLFDAVENIREKALISDPTILA